MGHESLYHLPEVWKAARFMTKNCRVCGAGLIKGANWYLSRAAKGDRICNECHRAKARQWNQDHREEETIRRSAYRKEHREEIAAYDREYRQSHRTTIMAAQRMWAASHRGKEYARRLQWIKENPEKSHEQSRRRRARLANVAIEPVDEKGIYSFYNDTCIYCGNKENLTLDHVIPLNGGGIHSESNLVVACRKCNGGKCDKPIEEWIQTQPRALAWLY